MSKLYDILIRGGRVIDGSGNPYFRADVAVRDGRITAVGPDIDPDSAQTVLEAEGRMVCPGFIDTHAHDDGYLIHNPLGDQKIRQGVTTEVIGNCGFTLAPVADDGGVYLDKVQTIMGGQEYPDKVKAIRSMADYLEVMDSVGLGINLIPLVGHATIRIAAMGWDNRPPTADELEEMKRLTAQAMEQGAAGLSSGLIYVPANFAATDELEELARVVGRYNGLYTTHMRSEGDAQTEAIEEALAIGRAGGVPVHISHHKVAGRANWGDSVKTLAAFQAARAEGLEVTCDQYPYPAGSSYLAACLPPAFASGGPDVWAAKLADPAGRAEIRAAIESTDGPKWDNLIKGAGFENLIIAHSAAHPDYMGRSLAEIAQQQDRDPFDVFFDAIAEEKMEILVIIFMMGDEDIDRIMRHPLTMIGSDGVPGSGDSRIHPRMTGTFPRVLGRYVRDKGVLGLEEAVRKMTSLPAQTFRAWSKGLVRVGFDADLVVFDPETIIDASTWAEPHTAPEGIDWVVVGGKVAVDHNRLTGERGGRVMRRERTG